MHAVIFDTKYEQLKLLQEAILYTMHLSSLRLTTLQENHYTPFTRKKYRYSKIISHSFQLY